MSFYEACDWSLLRAMSAALLAVPLSRWLSPLLTTRGRWRLPLTLLVLSPLLAPELLVGYGWSSFSLTQLHRPVVNHWLYFGLILLKSLPAGVIARACSPPPPVSTTAMHCDQLLGPRRNRLRGFGIRMRGQLLQELPVAGVVFLLVYQEFEIASLMQIPAWTVHLFDSQTVGLQPGETLRRMLWPVAIELLVLVPLMQFCLRADQASSERTQDVLTETPLRLRYPGQACVGPALAVLSFTLLWVTPLFLITASGLHGITGLAQNQVLLQSFTLDLLAAIVLGAGVAVLSLSISRLILHAVASRHGPSPASRSRRVLRTAVLWLSMIPGLAGSLVVCLGILLTIQLPALQSLRSTIIPAVLALTLFALPRAVLVQLLIGVERPSSKGFLARMLSAAPDAKRRSFGAGLIWVQEAKWLFIAGCVIFYWAMMNLTAAAFLCPPTVAFVPGSMTVVPLPVRLYNLMHFGRNGPLSMMALLSVLVPGLLMIVLAWILPGLYVRLKRSRSLVASSPK